MVVCKEHSFDLFSSCHLFFPHLGLIITHSILYQGNCIFLRISGFYWSRLKFSWIMVTLQVKASIVTTDCDQVQKGIVELVNRHGVRMLVMGAVPKM